MTSVGTGYDYSASTYSPDGRIFQVEYATKAIENSGTAIGIRFQNGVVLAVEKLVASKLLVPNSNRRILTVDEHIGLASTGLYADGKHIVKRAREEAHSYLDNYKSHIPGKHLAERIGNYVQAHTLYSSVRPFGTSVILGGVDHLGPQLFMVEPSGVYWGYRAIAVGKGHKVANTELEKLDLENMSAEDAVRAAARIILLCHDDGKDKPLEVEMTWARLLDDTPGKFGVHQRVPQEIVDQALQEAEELRNNEEDMQG